MRGPLTGNNKTAHMCPAMLSRNSATEERGSRIPTPLELYLDGPAVCQRLHVCLHRSAPSRLVHRSKHGTAHCTIHRAFYLVSCVHACRTASCGSLNSSLDYHSPCASSVVSKGMANAPLARMGEQPGRSNLCHLLTCRGLSLLHTAWSAFATMRSARLIR